MLLYGIIFISGAAILALELLASRIMTPYFGVSLYIWTGILSITLVALALGYWLGGRLAERVQEAAPLPRLLRLFAIMPAIASIAIVAACLIYPHLFVHLARASLVAGAFAACMVLLFVPLVAASAMNPLLVAIVLERARAGRPADAGAGKVFFVSTIGSVVGVLITAFLLIPYISNFAATLVVALVLAALALAAVGMSREPVAGSKAVATAAVAGLGAAVVLLWNADTYTGRLGPFAYGGLQWKLEASYNSLFGTVKVLRTAADADGRFQRIYFQDGLAQNTTDSSHRSTALYTYGLEALARAYRPQMRTALVLGLGAGIVPRELAASGIDVTAVDIDPLSPRVASAHFGFDPARVRLREADARTVVRQCRSAYDVVVVDLFHGDGTPDYLVTREFFRDLRGCLSPGGVAVFNTFADLSRPASYAHFLTTLRAELPYLALYRPRGYGNYVNSFVVAAAEPLPETARVSLSDVSPRQAQTLWNMLSAPVSLTAELFAGGEIVTDAVNPGAHAFAEMQLVYRRSVVSSVPAALLVN